MGEASWTKDFLAGTVAGIVSLAVAHPFDTVKTRLQVAQTGQYRGILDCLMRTARTEGVRSLFKGLNAPVVASVSCNAIVFSTYGATARLLSGRNEAPYAVQPMHIFLAGSAAGLVQVPLVCVSEVPLTH